MLAKVLTLGISVAPSSFIRGRSISKP